MIYHIILLFGKLTGSRRDKFGSTHINLRSNIVTSEISSGRHINVGSNMFDVTKPWYDYFKSAEQDDIGIGKYDKFEVYDPR